MPKTKAGPFMRRKIPPFFGVSRDIDRTMQERYLTAMGLPPVRDAGEFERKCREAQLARANTPLGHPASTQFLYGTGRFKFKAEAAPQFARASAEVRRAA